MLVKINYFEDLDPRSDINAPLSSVAQLLAAYVLRNGTKYMLNIYNDIEALQISNPDIDVSSLENLTQNFYIVADLLLTETFADITYEYNDQYAVLTQTLQVDGTMLISLHSEDNLVQYGIRVIQTTPSLIIVDPIVYTCKSLTDVNTNDELETLCRIHAQQTFDTLQIGVIELPKSYITTLFDGNDYLDDEALTISSMSDTIKYISKTGLDPDNEQTLSNVDYMVYVNGEAFTVEEDAVLDERYVYLRVVRGSHTNYYQLNKNSIYETQTISDQLKTKYSDKYCQLLLDKYLVNVEDITTEQIVAIQRLTTDQQVIAFLSGINVSFDDITGYNLELIDIDETNRVNSFSREKGYNELYQDAGSYGFTSEQINNFGAVLAKMMYDEVSTIFDSPGVLSYPATVEYLGYVSGSISIPSYLSTNTQLLVSSETKTKYLTECASSKFLLTNFNTRQFDWILSRLQYAITQIEAGYLIYEATLTDIKNMKSGFDLLKLIVNVNAASTATLESNIYTYFDKLYLLKLNQNVTQRLTFA